MYIYIYIYMYIYMYIYTYIYIYIYIYNAHGAVPDRLTHGVPHGCSPETGPPSPCARGIIRRGRDRSSRETRRQVYRTPLESKATAR